MRLRVLGCSGGIGGRKFTPLPAVHTVPAAGYHLDSGSGSLVFSGDCSSGKAC